MALKPITVSQLNEYISRVINTDPLLSNVTVKGEVSGVNYHSAGHLYFTIMDANSKIRCFYNKDYVRSTPFVLADGMEITISGKVNVYKQNGTYSFYVKNIEIEGDGNLAIAFEALKKKLDEKGFFDPGHKKPLPAFPKKIGVITSKTGAAIRDILKIIKNRNNIVDVILFPVLVEGDKAAGDIAEMINMVNQKFNDIDTLIVGRGGGAAETLWAFNDESVAQAIYDSHIPVISAVGHEIDFTIADFVADVRAETPTAAAQIAVPDVLRLNQDLDNLKARLYSNFIGKVDVNKLKLDKLKAEMTFGLNNKVIEMSNRLEKSRLILTENNPKKVLEKGFAVIEDERRHVITSKEDIKSNEPYKISFQDGSIDCIITEIGSKEK